MHKIKQLIYKSQKIVSFFLLFLLFLNEITLLPTSFSSWDSVKCVFF